MLARARDANFPGYPAQQHTTRWSNQENEGSAYFVENQIWMILRSSLLWQIFTYLSSRLFKYRKVWTFHLKCGNEYESSFGYDFGRVRTLARSGSYLCHVRPSARISAAPTGRISAKFDTVDFYENLSIKSKFDYKLIKTSATLRVGLIMFYCCRRHKVAVKAFLTTMCTE
jgi:hypothetical protein